MIRILSWNILCRLRIDGHVGVLPYFHGWAQVADLLVGFHELQNHQRNSCGIQFISTGIYVRKLFGNLYRSDLVLGLHQLNALCHDQHDHFCECGTPSSLCLFALSVYG